MKISGFTIIKNAIDYDFPIVESIKSVLPLVDEFIIALGDSTDETNALVATIDSPKIKIIHTVWDQATYQKAGSIYAYQTDLAKRECTGDWCVYIQADEVLHEEALPIIRKACNEYLHNAKIEGFALKYYHFYGSYDRHIDNMHFAYPNEIRIIRNHPDIHSWKDAQSFRKIKDFDYKDYYQKEGAEKLNVLMLPAYMYHYGYCRDPRKMGKKKKEQVENHYGEDGQQFAADIFDYGNLSYLPQFKGTHPAIMQERIAYAQKEWGHYLRYEGPKPAHLPKVFKTKYRIVSYIENKLLGGYGLGVFKNYKKLGHFKP